MKKTIFTGMALAFVLGVIGVLGSTHDVSLLCQHLSIACDVSKNTSKTHAMIGNGSHGHNAGAMTQPTEAGQDMFGTLSEINRLIEGSGKSWENVDMDRLWAHLKDMNALMTGVTVEKETLVNGLRMKVSGNGLAKRAMDNMLPAHSEFLRELRPDWKIELSPLGQDYELKLTSAVFHEVQRIQALGFSGFMVQDNHHAVHHLGLVMGAKIH